MALSFDPDRIREMLDSLQEGLQLLSFDFRYLYVNETVARQGKKTREELLGHTMAEVYPGIEKTPLFKTLTQCMTERRAVELENEFVHASGEREWYELRIRPAPEGLVVLSVDVTARKRLESTMRQVQKMDAIGKLAGGVAHDFNNLLTVISSCASFLKQDLPAGDDRLQDVKEILDASTRAAKLTRQLLTFSRHQPVRPVLANMNEVVRALLPMLERLLGQVRVKMSLAPSVENVRIDVNAIEQVLVNLAVNGRDAMPDGGELIFETRDLEVENAYAEARGAVIPPGQYVVTSVSDTGTGMPREVQERLFEPFFTTKPEGKGTGLGLATSYGIVRQAGGYIWVYSEPGRGSTFKVYLPRATREPDAEEAPPPAVAAQRSGETILAVDDDPHILAIVERTLTGAGYRVLRASNVAEAERAAESCGGAIDLLFTDIVLPGESGLELSARLASKFPKVRILMTSGFTEATQRVSSPGAHLLEKPFTPDALLRAVRAALTS